VGEHDPGPVRAAGDRPASAASSSATRSAAASTTTARRCKVSATLWTDYQRGAEQVAEQVAADPELLAKIAPHVDGDSDTKARAFITAFGRRAYRRPLTAEEVARHLEIFNLGVAAPGDLGRSRAASASSSRPCCSRRFFLYRVESSDVVVGGNIPLSDHEIAAKLSYMLWNTMPDDELFAAADAGRPRRPPPASPPRPPACSTTRAPTTWSPLPLPAAQVDHYSDIYKDPVKYPNFDPSLNPLMVTETMMFVDDVVFNDGDLATLLTAPYTFVNAPSPRSTASQGQPATPSSRSTSTPPSAPACSPRSASSPATPAPSRTTRSTAACS
jgi:hypothetical protein